jgi:hypothetical protein
MDLDTAVQIAVAARAHGKHAGIGGVYEETLMRRYVGMGVRLVLGEGTSAL